LQATSVLFLYAVDDRGHGDRGSAGGGCPSTATRRAGRGWLLGASSGTLIRSVLCSGGAAGDCGAGETDQADKGAHNGVSGGFGCILRRGRDIVCRKSPTPGPHRMAPKQRTASLRMSPSSAPIYTPALLTRTWGP
jgi:hypothetical protein